jgi:hypothetical protein
MAQRTDRRPGPGQLELRFEELQEDVGEWAARSRAAQGLPADVEDQAVLAVVAKILVGR